MAYDDTLPTRLRMERARLNIRQKDVASATGLTAASICTYELGQRMPTLQSLETLAEFYGVSIDYLTGRE